MKKLKKFYKTNRIYCILMIISIICVLVIGLSLIIYFVKQAKSSPYGSRLEGIENYNVQEDISSINEHLKEYDYITFSEVRTQGRIIYVDIKVKDETEKEEVENIAVSIMDLISEENANYYDVQFIFARPSYDAYLGSVSSNDTLITWINKYDVEPNTKKED